MKLLLHCFSKPRQFLDQVNLIGLANSLPDFWQIPTKSYKRRSW